MRLMSYICTEQYRYRSGLGSVNNYLYRSVRICIGTKWIRQIQRNPRCKRAGRRGFDAAEALDKALHVFWQHGYEGASLSDLTEAMGINRPSLYAAFGNKEELFRRALDRYAEKGPGAVHRKALAEPTARAVVERLLNGVAEFLTEPNNPPGCLAVQGALSCGRSVRIDKKRTMSSSRR